MFGYALHRFVSAVPTLFLIIAFSFFMMRLAPGGPFDQERKLPAVLEAAMKKNYHLDEPLPLQFVRYLGNIAKGDFGPSFRHKDFTVTELIKVGFPVSLQLGFSAIVLAMMIGLTLGILAAFKQNSTVDYTASGISLLGLAVPNFVVGPILTLAFGVYWGLLPVGGWGGGVKYAILPILVLCLPQIASVTRLTRASMIEVLSSNFVRTARAKGLPEYITLTRHAIRAALLPVVSYLGPAIANTITGSVVVEQIFSIPGMGRYFVEGSLNRDYTLVMGVTIFYGFIIIFCNLIADLAYGFLDPKIRYD